MNTAPGGAWSELISYFVAGYSHQLQTSAVMSKNMAFESFREFRIKISNHTRGHEPVVKQELSLMPPTGNNPRHRARVAIR